MSSPRGKKRKVKMSSISGPVFHMAYHRARKPPLKLAPTRWLVGKTDSEQEQEHHVQQPPADMGIIPDTIRKESSTYFEKKKKEAFSWLSMRDELFSAAIERKTPLTCDGCSRCGQEDVPLFRCTDCLPRTLCRACMIDVHPIQRLHVIEEWNGQYFCEADFMELKRFEPVCHLHCTYHKELVVTLIDKQGRTHDGCIVPCCPELTETACLVKQDFWPLSPVNPSVAVSVQLLSQSVCFTLEAQVSTKGFVSSLNMHNKAFKCGKLAGITRGESIHEFRLHWQRLQDAPYSVLGLDSDRKNGCPACPQESGTLVLSLDANFGLVHKANAGYSHVESALSPKMFYDQTLVDSFVDEYSGDTKRPDKECSQFQASSAIRSKNKSANLTVTGIFGSVCRHEVPNRFMNVRHGERLAYSVYIIKDLLDKTMGKNVQLHIMYDIACVLQAHLKKSGQTGLLDKISLAIPIFHSYGHKGDCQVTMNPRRLEGFGLVDGEQTERLWSYLRLFAKITKEQTPMHRLDLLTMALLHYSSLKINKMDEQLLEKLSKARKTEQVATERLQNLLSHSQTVSTDGTIEKWKQDEKRTLLKQTLKKKSKLTWQENYGKDLIKFYSIQSQVQSQLLLIGENTELDHHELVKQKARLEKDLAAVETVKNINRWSPDSVEYREQLKNVEDEQKQKLLYKCRNLAAEKDFLSGLRKKYASGGQSIANRIAGQVKRATKSLRTTIDIYNQASFASTDSLLPNKLEYEEMKNSNSEIYSTLEMQSSDDQQPSTVEGSASFRRDVLDASALKDRAVEECINIIDDISRTQQHLVDIHKDIVLQYNNIDGNSPYARGLQILIAKEITCMESKLMEINKRFSHYVPNIPVIDTTGFISQVQPETSAQYISDIDEDSVYESTDDECSSSCDL